MLTWTFFQFPDSKYYVPGAKGTPSPFLCRYCMAYRQSAGALRLHVLKKRGTDCSKKHQKGKGRANYFEWVKCKYVCEWPNCGSRLISKHNLDVHMATEHRWSNKTKSLSLKLEDSKNAMIHKKRVEDRAKRRDEEARPPSKKTKVSQKERV